MLGRIGGSAIGMITQVFLAQMLSVAALGTFFLATSTAALLGVLSTCGLSLVTARFLVRYRSRGRGDFSGLYMTSASLIVLIAALALTSAAVVAILLWPDFSGGERAALAIGCLAAPGLALARLSSSAATAYRRFRLTHLPELVVRPAAFLAIVVAIGMLSSRLDLNVVLAVFALLVTAQAAYQIAALRGVVGRGVRPRHTAWRLPAMWLKAAAPLIGVVVLTAVFADAAILSAGLFLGAEDLAVFGVCVKIVLIVGFMQAATHKMLQPDLAEALIGRDRHRLVLTIGRANWLTIGIGAAAFVALILAGDLVLSLFGEHFVQGRSVLLLLLGGQVMIAAAGPAIQVLTLTRRQSAAAWSSVAAGLCLVASNALLVPLWGLGGAAAAMVATQLLWAVLLALQVRRIGIVCDVFAPVALPPRDVPRPVASS
jgi:O-antigen/teichoic acid export membrane protein